MPKPLDAPAPGGFPRRLLLTLGALAIATGGLLSWFASSQPDGLEWSMARVTGQPELVVDTSTLHRSLAELQQQIAPLPDYTFASTGEKTSAATNPTHAQQAWPAVDAGTSLAGVLGGGATLLLVMGIGYLLRPRRA